MKTADEIHEEIFHKRLDKNKDYRSIGWHLIEIRSLKGRDDKGTSKLDKKILELLEQGYRVKGGYFTTSIRGFHEYYIMYKDLTYLPNMIEYK